MLTPESRQVTTFTTHTGLFRYRRLLFGVNSAPEIYQNEIRKVLAGIPGVANMSDDIVVHGKNKEEHDIRLKQVFERLSNNGLTLNKDKSVFGVDEIEFLGHNLSKAGLSPGKGKIEAVQNFKQPKDASEVRSFLGLVTYLARFIPNLSSLSEPLRKLTHKAAKFDFGKSQVEAFNKLKEILASPKVLGFFDADAETKLIVDASPVGLGAVLVQIQHDVPRVISYANRSLSSVERRYSQTEKEGLAIVWACERFQSYLIGKKFTLMTDHRPLLNIYSRRSKPQARLERWVLRLQSFDFDIVYIKGEHNIADPLSRLLSCGGEKVEKSHLEDMAFVRFVALNATPRAISTKELERESELDTEISSVLECLQYDNWSNYNGPVVYKSIKDELCVVGKLLLRGHRIVVPQKFRPYMVTLAHEGHLGIVGTKQALRSKVFWPGMDRDVERFCKARHGCQITSRMPNPEPIRTTQLPSGPWVDIAIDYLGPLPSGECILVVIDYYSRWFEVAFMPDSKISTQSTITELDKIFFRHGLPSSIKSDNGPQFRSLEFSKYCEHLDIKHYRVIPKWPQANGEVERQNSSLLKRIRIAYAENHDYKQEVYKYMMSYRGNVHPATGKSPAELLYGRNIRMKIPSTVKCFSDVETRDHDSLYKGRSKVYTDNRRGAEYSDIKVGDMVLLKNEKVGKAEPQFHPQPVKVVDRVGPKIVIETASGNKYERNVAVVKRYCPLISVTGELPTPEAPEMITSTLPDTSVLDSIEEADTEADTTQEPNTLETPNTEMSTDGLPASTQSRRTVPPRSRKPPPRYRDENFITNFQ
jgi:transposase InsO family protein